MSLILEAWRQQGYAPAGGEQLLKDYEDKLQLEQDKQDLIYALKYPPAPPPPSPWEMRDAVYAELYPPSNDPAPEPQLEDLSDGTLGVAGDVHAIRRVLDEGGVEHYLPFRHNSIVIGLPDVAKARELLTVARQNTRRDPYANPLLQPLSSTLSAESPVWEQPSTQPQDVAITGPSVGDITADSGSGTYEDPRTAGGDGMTVRGSDSNDVPSWQINNAGNGLKLPGGAWYDDFGRSRMAPEGDVFAANNGDRPTAEPDANANLGTSPQPIASNRVPDNEYEDYRDVLTPGERVPIQQVAPDTFGPALDAVHVNGFQTLGAQGNTSDDFLRQNNDMAGFPLATTYSGGQAWATDVAMRRQAGDPLSLIASAGDAASVLRRAQALWGPMPPQAARSYLSDTATNTQHLAWQMQQAGYSGELVPVGGSVRITPGSGQRPAMVNGVSVNHRADAAFQAANDLLGMGQMHRDYKLLAGLMGDAQQAATLNRLQRALQDRLGQVRMLPTPEALGAAPSIGADGRVGYRHADLIDRYGDALRKTEMWRHGIIELDTRTMTIISIGNQRMSPEQWVEENTQRYLRDFNAGLTEGRARYARGELRYRADIPEHLQISMFAHQRAEVAVKGYNWAMGVPEGAGLLLSMNRWTYDPNGSGMTTRPDMLMDLGPNRGNLIQRFVVDGKSSMAEALLSNGQFGRASDWLGGASVKAATPQGLVPWTPRLKGR